MSWTDERVEQLKQMWIDGLSASQIAARLGGVTRNAVIGKVHRLGLSGRGAPTRVTRRRPAAPRAPRATTASSTPRRETASKKTAVAPAPEPEELEVISDPDAQANLLELTEQTCKWPNGDPGDESFHYDATDNLIARYGATPEMQLNIDYRQLPATSEIDGEVKQVSHDARGNMITDGDFDYAFNAASQLTSIAQFPGMSFRYDGHGRRLISADESGSRYSLYNRAGALMYVDGCEQGGEVSEFVYLADDPVARLDSECADGCHP